jgi:hypothetical protein
MGSAVAIKIFALIRIKGDRLDSIAILDLPEGTEV